MNWVDKLAIDALKVSIYNKLYGKAMDGNLSEARSIISAKVKLTPSKELLELERNVDILSLLLETNIHFTNRVDLYVLYSTPYEDFFDHVFMIIDSMVYYEVTQTRNEDLYLTEDSTLRANLKGIENMILQSTIQYQMEPDSTLLTSLHQEIQVALTYIEKHGKYELMPYVRDSELTMLYALKRIPKTTNEGIKIREGIPTF